MTKTTADYTIPGKNQGGTTDAGVAWYIRSTYETLAVLDSDAGPCATCDKPMVRLHVREHIDHNGSRYPMTFDFIYLHADGSEAHDGKITNCVKPQCPQCRAYGTVTVKDTGYGDQTTCSACGYNHYYDRGD